MKDPLHIDENLARAETLPARCYTDPSVLPDEQEALFARTWQLCGTTAQVRAVGDYFTTQIAGEPLVIVRDEDSPHALTNVCRHRGGPVAVGAGNRRSLQCAYHGWTYSLDGSLRKAPEMEGCEGLEPLTTCLPAAQLDALGPLLLVNLSVFSGDPPAPRLRSCIPEVFALTAPLQLAALSPVARREYVVACNWKVYVDNYLEGYHLPMVHPGLHRELDYDAYRTELFASSSLQRAPLRAGAGPGRRYTDPALQQRDPLYFWIFPNLMLNVYPDHVSTNRVVPLSQDQTLVVFEWYASAPAAAAAGVEFSDEIHREDAALCEAVQRGLCSRTYDRGRYSPRRESGVHHFHRLWAAYMERHFLRRGSI